MLWFALILGVSLLPMLLLNEDVKTKLRQSEQMRGEGKIGEAAEMMLQYIADGGETAETDYEAACLLTMNAEVEMALEYLIRACDHGWINVEWMEEDPDLAPLREHPRWHVIVSKVQAALEERLAILPMQHSFADAIPLPAPALDSATSVEKALQQRRSIRNYADSTLSLAEVSQLLWAAYGVTYVRAPERLRGGFKTAPAAGACYPLDVYLAAWNVDGLNPGYYYYEPDGHKLFLVRPGDFQKELGEACHYQECVASAPASLIWSAIFERNTRRYGSRGRARYVCMDLGHSAENVYLQAETMKVGTVGVGSFDDLQLSLTVHMTRAEEPLYVMPVGKKQ